MGNFYCYTFASKSKDKAVYRYEDGTWNNFHSKKSTECLTVKKYSIRVAFLLAYLIELDL